MSKEQQEQKPIVGIGTQLPIGKVVAIKNDHVIVENEGRSEEYSFFEIEVLV